MDFEELDSVLRKGRRLGKEDRSEGDSVKASEGGLERGMGVGGTD